MALLADGQRTLKAAPAPAPNPPIVGQGGGLHVPVSIQAPLPAPVPSRQAAPAKPATPASRQPAPAKVNTSYAGTAKPVSYGSSSQASVAPASFSGGGGSSASSAGGGGGGISADATGVIAPVPTTETITIPDAMADPTYIQKQTELARQLADFKAQQQLADAQYTGSYDQTTRKLGRNGDKWDPTLQNGQYGQTVNANVNDFAGRGLYNSGEFAKSQSDVDADFNSRPGEIDRARNDFRDTAALSERNMEGSQETVRQQALAAAVAGIAAKYGVNLDPVNK